MKPEKLDFEAELSGVIESIDACGGHTEWYNRISAAHRREVLKVLERIEKYDAAETGEYVMAEIAAIKSELGGTTKRADAISVKISSAPQPVCPFCKHEVWDNALTIAHERCVIDRLTTLKKGADGG